jgi:heme-degrading monooxygenase HmoA
MMTIVTHVKLKQDGEPEWDMVMRERLTAARHQPGWLGAQLAIPLDAPEQRIIIGVWQTRADWEAWHTDPAFTETRRRLESLEAGPSRHWWHEVIEDMRPASATHDTAA